MNRTWTKLSLCAGASTPEYVQQAEWLLHSYWNLLTRSQKYQDILSVDKCTSGHFGFWVLKFCLMYSTFDSVIIFFYITQVLSVNRHSHKTILSSTWVSIYWLDNIFILRCSPGYLSVQNSAQYTWVSYKVCNVSSNIDDSVISYTLDQQIMAVWLWCS